MRFLRTRVTSFAASRKDGAQILLLPRLTLNLQAWVYSSISSRKPTMHASCDCVVFFVPYLSGTSALRSSFEIKLSCSNRSPRHDLNTIQFEKPFVYEIKGGCCDPLSATQLPYQPGGKKSTVKMPCSNRVLSYEKRSPAWYHAPPKEKR